jgi:hypothetical protein
MEDPAAALLSGLAYLAVGLAVAIVSVGAITAILQLPIIRDYRRRRILKRLEQILEGLTWPPPYSPELPELRESDTERIRVSAQHSLEFLSRLTMADWHADGRLQYLIRTHAYALRQSLSAAEPREDPSA